MTLTLPANLTADATSKPYANLAAGRGHDGQLHRLEHVHERDAADHGDARATRRRGNVNVRITTTYGATGDRVRGPDAGIVPEDVDPGSAPPRRRWTARRAPASTPGEALDIGRKWEPGGATRNCSPVGVDCGSVERAGHGQQHLRQGHALRRRPVLLHPRQGRLPVLRGQAGRVRRRTGWPTRSRS